MVQINTTSLEPYLSEQAWELLAEHLRLSPREAQIVRRVFANDKEQAIAMAMDISPHTVRTHMERLYRKLNVQTRVELVTLVVATFLRMTAEPDSDLPPICGERAAGRCPYSD